MAALPKVQGPPSMGNKAFTILVAEDDEDDRVIFEAVLEAVGYRGECRFVSSAKELFDYLTHEGNFDDVTDLPNVIVLDLRIPMQSRCELLKKVRSEPAYAEIPVVVLATSVEKGDVQRYDLQADAFVTKPIEFDHYVEDLKSALEPFCKEVMKSPDRPTLRRG
jgi:CheY-like chemotaxis protein